MCMTSIVFFLVVPFRVMRPTNSYTTALLQLLTFSPVDSLLPPFSSSVFLTPLFVQVSHLICGPSLLLQPRCHSVPFGGRSSSICTKSPACISSVLAILLVKLNCLPISPLRSFILLLSTLFATVILWTQFCHQTY